MAPRRHTWPQSDDQAIELTIGHMKSDGKLGRNWLKGALGDAMHAVLFGAAQNIRLIINID